MADDILVAKRLREALPIVIVFASLGVGLGIAALLYFGREIFVPIALGIILSFVLAPLVRVLQKLLLPRGVAVLCVVVAAGLAFALLAFVVFGQLTQLTSDLPRYQANMQTKVSSLRALSTSSGALGRALEMVQNFGAQLETPTAGAARQDGKEAPMPVEIREAENGPLARLGAVAAPLLHPLATFGLVLIFAIFILIQREDLRNRFIRLVGTDDLQRTTAALDDAGRRLSRLFLTQLAMNAGFGVVIGVGLWFIGLPSAVLWGILAGVLRFIPYIGAAIAALMPMALAVFVDPGWSMVVWTAILFITVEPIVGHGIEPLVYGHSTGLSPIAVIVAATVWTFLWGSVGLVLATPLTVCLVVLGRHVKALAWLDILLGDRPALSPRQIFYQRMLAGDPAEAIEQARDFLKARALATYYDEVALEGLRLAQEDAARGALAGDRETVLKASVETLIDELASVKGPLPTHSGAFSSEAAAAFETIGPDRQLAIDVRAADQVNPAWCGATPVLCIYGPTALDRPVALMLGQLFTKHGLPTRVAGPEALTMSEQDFADQGIALIVFSYLDALSTVHIRYAARRMRRLVGGRPRVIVGLWRQRDPATVETLRRSTSADMLATSLHGALAAAIDMARATPDAAAAPVKTKELA